MPYGCDGGPLIDLLVDIPIIQQLTTVSTQAPPTVRKLCMESAPALGIVVFCDVVKVPEPQYIEKEQPPCCNVQELADGECVSSE